MAATGFVQAMPMNWIQPLAGRTRTILPATALIVLVLLSGCSKDSGDARDHESAGARGAAGATAGEQEWAGSSHRCTGTLGAGTVSVVRVPAGTTCRLLGTTVTGDVVVGLGGQLVARRATVGGDVIARRARRVSITSRTLVEGNVVLTHGDSGVIGAAQIRGNLRWSMQTGLGTIRHTVIGGDLVASGGIGRLVISGNRIRGDLRCRENLRAPVTGVNLVAGRRTGRCAAPRVRAFERRGGGHVRPAPTQSGRPPCAGDSVSDDPSDEECGDD